MLDQRRLLEFSSRVHTYLLSLSCFLFLLLLLAVNISVHADFLYLLGRLSTVLSWVFILEGMWILIYSVWLSIQERVFIMKPAVLTMLRAVVYAVLLFLFDALELLMTEGLTIGVGL